jgi:5'-nucleotidase
MKILLTNDDGFEAPGLWALWDILKDDHDLYLCAPQRQQSGTAHRLTLDRPIRATRIKRGGDRSWQVDGTPADCVKLALRSLIDEPIDLVISGINQGSNAGVLVHYSGTVAAAKEAVSIGVPAIAVSLCGYRGLDYVPAAEIAVKVVNELARTPLPAMTFLNVNVPNIKADEIKGIRVVPMSTSLMADGYERRVDPRGRSYYWLAAELNFGKSDRYDDHKAVADGYVSVSPLTMDWTCQPLIERLSSLEEAP